MPKQFLVVHAKSAKPLAQGFMPDAAACARAASAEYGANAVVFERYDGTNFTADPAAFVPTHYRGRPGADDWVFSGSAEVYEGLTTAEADEVRIGLGAERAFRSPPEPKSYGSIAGQPVGQALRVRGTTEILNFGHFTGDQLAKEYGGLEADESIYLQTY